MTDPRDEQYADTDCPGCQGGDKVPADADYWCCPACGTEWNSDGHNGGEDDHD